MSQTECEKPIEDLALDLKINRAIEEMMDESENEHIDINDIEITITSSPITNSSRKRKRSEGDANSEVGETPHKRRKTNKTAISISNFQYGKQK